jgi:AraC-like DNA-binding protein
VFLNLLLMPTLWFFTRNRFDKSFHLTARDLIHAIPAFISLVSYILYYAPMTSGQLEADRAFREGGGENLADDINNILLYAQVFIYYTAIFLYIRKRKKYLQDNYSDSDYVETKWTTSFLVVSFVLFFAVFVGYLINPRTDVWLIPILNMIVMGYLVFIVVKHSTSAYLNRLPDIPATDAQERESAAPAMSAEQMKEISDKVTEYLQSSKAYIAPNFSIHRLAGETDIQWKNISTAINGYLHKNFYELVNEMRIEEAKRLLRGLSPQYTADSVFPDCGFRSRSAFYASFKKYERVSPDRWRRENA